jgi:hypothetical protein
MKVSEKTIISTRKLECLPNNPRKITNESLNRLCDSIRNNGYWEHRPAAVEPIEGTDRYYVLDGNQRLKALRRLKRYEMPCVIYTELTEAERDDIILRSNINNGEWEADILQMEFAPRVEFEDIGLNIELPQAVPDDKGKDVGKADNDNEPDEDDEPIDEEKRKFYLDMLGDYVYPSNNEFDIPTLLMDNMPVHLELPLNPWGAEARYKKGITTYHFYVDDYRFEQLFKDPIKLLESGCKAIVEPNCSIHDQTPMAHAIWQTYRKRYLCRYLQECGMQIWVDLNVSPHFEEVNALGVPEGYNAFCTRGVTGWLNTTERHWEMAKRISGLDKPNMFVYGGGDDVAEWCKAHDVVHVKEFMNRGRE